MTNGNQTESIIEHVTGIVEDTVTQLVVEDTSSMLSNLGSDVIKTIVSDYTRLKVDDVLLSNGLNPANNTLTYKNDMGLLASSNNELRPGYRDSIIQSLVMASKAELNFYSNHLFSLHKAIIDRISNIDMESRLMNRLSNMFSLIAVDISEEEHKLASELTSLLDTKYHIHEKDLKECSNFIELFIKDAMETDVNTIKKVELPSFVLKDLNKAIKSFNPEMLDSIILSLNNGIRADYKTLFGLLGIGLIVHEMKSDTKVESFLGHIYNKIRYQYEEETKELKDRMLVKDIYREGDNVYLEYYSDVFNSVLDIEDIADALLGIAVSYYQNTKLIKKYYLETVLENKSNYVELWETFKQASLQVNDYDRALLHKREYATYFVELKDDMSEELINRLPSEYRNDNLLLVNNISKYLNTLSDTELLDPATVSFGIISKVLYPDTSFHRYVSIGERTKRTNPETPFEEINTFAIIEILVEKLFEYIDVRPAL